MNNLRIYTLLAVIFVFAASLMTSCLSPEEEDIDFTAQDIIGKWSSSYDWVRFDDNGKGVTWVPEDDVTEAEGQVFEWTLELGILTYIHLTEMHPDGTRSIPKVYKVLELNSTTLTYEEEHTGKIFTYTRE